MLANQKPGHIHPCCPYIRENLMKFCHLSAKNINIAQNKNNAHKWRDKKQPHLLEKGKGWAGAKLTLT